MNVAVVVFPGSNCELDVVHAFGLIGVATELVWHRETDLDRFDGVVLPGGFAHGDYLRTGAIAKFSPVMAEVVRMADDGRPILGICNGFQILCEAGLLPGALVANRDLRFICRPVRVVVENTASVLTRAAEPGRVLWIPLNSYHGNYVAPPGDLASLEAEGQVVLRYSDVHGDATKDNPNGSMNGIAGLANRPGNVVGLMPHPERASEPILGSSDGRILLESFAASLVARVAAPI
jgi:phosphoribosylformylglycinamidine synthase I